MKVVRLTKKDLNGDFEALYTKLDMVKDRSCSPSDLYVSLQDYNTMEKNLIASFKKSYPGISKIRLQYAVGSVMLNLSPNTILSKAIKPGYALVDKE